MDEMELKRPTTRRSRAPLFFAVVLLLGVFGIVYSLREDIATLTNGMLSNRPNGRTRPTLFINHREYQTLNREDDYLWDALLPDNGGFLWQEEEDGVRHVHGISMLHQLHCLQMIRTQMMDFKEKTEDNNKMHHIRGAHQHHGEGYKHVLHCLDYLRQSILCCADDTIEGHRVSNGFEIVNSTAIHQCSDPSRLYDLSIASGYEHA